MITIETTLPLFNYCKLFFIFYIKDAGGHKESIEHLFIAILTLSNNSNHLNTIS